MDTVRKSKRKNSMEDQGVNQRILLNSIFKEWKAKLWIGFIWWDLVNMIMNLMVQYGGNFFIS